MGCLKAGHKIYLPLLHVWSHCYLLATKKRLNRPLGTMLPSAICMSLARYSFLHNIANLSRIVVHGDLVSCDFGMTITVAVMPAASVMWRGTLSIFIRTREPHPV
jgi:hypothetical protein